MRAVHLKNFQFSSIWSLIYTGKKAKYALCYSTYFINSVINSGSVEALQDKKIKVFVLNTQIILLRLSSQVCIKNTFNSLTHIFIYIYIYIYAFVLLLQEITIAETNKGKTQLHCFWCHKQISESTCLCYNYSSTRPFNCTSVLVPIYKQKRTIDL